MEGGKEGGREGLEFRGGFRLKNQGTFHSTKGGKAACLQGPGRVDHADKMAACASVAE